MSTKRGAVRFFAFFFLNLIFLNPHVFGNHKLIDIFYLPNQTRFTPVKNGDVF